MLRLDREGDETATPANVCSVIPMMTALQTSLDGRVKIKRGKSLFIHVVFSDRHR